MFLRRDGKSVSVRSAVTGSARDRAEVGSVRQRIEESIARVRSSLGTTIVELIGVSGDIVKVRIVQSGCAAGDPSIPTMYSMPVSTALMLVEEQMQEDVPEIKRVIAVE